MDARTALDVLALVAATGTAVSALLRGRRQRARGAATARLRAAGVTRPHLPGVSLSAVVLSATPGPNPGGDIVDAFKLDSRFTMLLVADVSGKGAEAAAHTAFIKYTIRTLALDGDGDPAVVLAKFNAIFEQTVEDDEAFVVLILGVMDSHTGDLRYASAGHEPAFLRRCNGHVRLLAPTGPIIGAAPLSSYGSSVLTLDPGDILVWTTDGITESRDRKRRLLGVDGLGDWVAAAPRDVALVADWIVASLRRRSGGAVQDDVAVLAMALETAASAVTPAPVRARR
jgi:sigma-B regulation protein RsbU (phosphoserine phosphatase)